MGFRMNTGHIPELPHYTCPICGMTSYHPKDIDHEGGV
jgi:hypothetical protein